MQKITCCVICGAYYDTTECPKCNPQQIPQVVLTAMSRPVPAMQPKTLAQIWDEVESVKRGQIFYASWGYDQTNIDFVSVREINPSGKTATCMMVGKCSAGEAHVAPNNVLYGPAFKMKIHRYQGRPYLRGSYPFIVRENGATASRLGSMSRYTNPVYETPAGLGH